MNPIDEAIKIANRSTHRRHMTGCIIVNNKGEIISNGWSHMGTWRMTELYSMHAEIHAIIRARHIKDQLREAQIYIATIARNSGALTNSKPCITCASALIAVGIEAVEFTCGSLNRRPATIFWKDISEFLEDLKVYPKRSESTKPKK